MMNPEADLDLDGIRLEDHPKVLSDALDVLEADLNAVTVVTQGQKGRGKQSAQENQIDHDSPAS